MTKVIVDKEQLEKLLEVIGDDCPAEIFNEEISWCSEEFCINCGEYDCIKKWLKVKELPKRKILEDISLLVEYSDLYDWGKAIGFNACLDEILGEENDTKRIYRTG